MKFLTNFSKVKFENYFILNKSSLKIFNNFLFRDKLRVYAGFPPNFQKKNLGKKNKNLGKN